MGFLNIIRKEFQQNKEITLDDLYDSLKNRKDVKVEPSKLKHRVRSAIYNLKKYNEIIWVKKATYKKNPKKIFIF